MNLLHPDFAPSYHWLSIAYSEKRMYQEAMDASQKAKLLSGNPRSIAYLGYIYAMAGKKNEALKMRDDMMTLSGDRLEQFACPMAILHIGLGQKEQAFFWLEKAYERHDFILNFIKVDPRYDPIRLDPRFEELLIKMGCEK